MAYPLCSLPPSPSAYPTHPLNSRTPTMSRIPRSNQSINHSKISLFLSLSSSYRLQQRSRAKKHSSEEQNTTLFSFHLPSNFSFSSPPHYSFSFHDRRHRQQDKKGESLALCVKTLHLPTIVCCSAVTVALRLVIFFSYRDTVRERSCH